MRVCSNGAPLIRQPAADSFPPQGGSLGAKQNASPLSVSGVRRNNSIRPTVPPCLRPQNGPSLVTAVTGGPGIAFCRTERGAEWKSILHSAFCILHSPAALEWYRLQKLAGRFQPLRPSLGGFCGFFSIVADLTRVLYHRGGELSRWEIETSGIPVGKRGTLPEIQGIFLTLYRWNDTMGARYPVLSNTLAGGGN